MVNATHDCMMAKEAKESYKIVCCCGCGGGGARGFGTSSGTEKGRVGEPNTRGKNKKTTLAMA